MAGHLLTSRFSLTAIAADPCPMVVPFAAGAFGHFSLMSGLGQCTMNQVCAELVACYISSDMLPSL